MAKEMRELEKWLLIAEKAVCRAGMFLSQAKVKDKKIRADLGKDVKISADLHSEKIIIDILRAKTEFDILTEERGFLPGGSEKRLLWIVDPLDGTMNFLRGIPISCVSVGLWRGKRPLLGVIYDFNKNELFSGIAGKIAFLNQRRVKVSAVSEEANAVLCTGFPVNTYFSSNAILKFTKQIQSYKKVRLIGSAALSLAYVAAGRADVYHENNIMLWDIAAGAAIVTGSGGKVQMLPLAKENTFSVYASNRRLFR